MAGFARHGLRQCVQQRCILVRQRADHLLELGGLHRHAGEHAAHDARVGQVDHQAAQAGHTQRVEREFLHLEVGLQPGVAEDLGTELQRLA